jgi:hypothetical protein
MADGYKTVLIDRREIGHGSTSAQHPCYNMRLTPVSTYRFDWRKAAVESYYVTKSIDDLRKIVQQVKSDCGFMKRIPLFCRFKERCCLVKKESEEKKIECPNG